VEIRTFVRVVSSMPSNISILARGPHGIGKSQIFKQVADNLELPLIDRRLSQMTEGDIIGLPELADGVTRFCPVDWVLQACREPVVLLLDEINRATPEVMQCAFQLVLDRELNGNVLHPETRVYCAVNASADYQVNEMDPALLDRFWVADLDPDKADWIEWATNVGNIDPLLIEFIDQNPAHLRHVGQTEPGKVYPTPRSYERLDRALKHANMSPTEVGGGASPEGFYACSLGFIGVEAAIALQDFVKNYEFQVTAEDVVDHFPKKKKKLGELSNDKRNSLIEKVVAHCNDNEWTVKQCKNISDFAKAGSDEMLVSLWNGVMETGKVPNITKLHKFLGQAVVDAVTSARNI
jgi:hypothetical protein